MTRITRLIALTMLWALTLLIATAWVRGLTGHADGVFYFGRSVTCGIVAGDDQGQALLLYRIGSADPFSTTGLTTSSWSQHRWRPFVESDYLRHRGVRVAGFAFLFGTSLNRRGGAPGGDWSVVIPYWFLLLAFGAPAVWWLARILRARRRLSRGLCPDCGYDLRATPGRCPECGRLAMTNRDPKAD